MTWEILRLRLELDGIITRTPRETLQGALQIGLVDNGNLWSDLQKMRNLTSHTYKEKLAEDVYGFVVGQGLELFRQLVETSKTWPTSA